MKKLYSLFLILFSILFAQAQSIDLSGVTYTVDSLENHQVGPGTYYTQLRLRAPSKRLDVFFLKADISNPTIDIRTTLGRDSIYGGERISEAAKRKSKAGSWYFAGTNGDFYDTSAPYAGYPVGGNMVDGEITKIPNTRGVFVFDDAKIPDVGVVSYNGLLKHQGESLKINSVNHLRGADALVLYNRFNGKTTRTNIHGTEVLVELLEGYEWGTNKTLKAKVLDIETGKGGMAIPAGKAVLSGHGVAKDFLNNLAVDDVVEIDLNLKTNNNSTSNFLQMTAGDGYKFMLLNGVVEQSNVWAEKHPRTGLGFSQNRDTIIFCVVDGRGASNGATTKELAELMKSAGAWSAVNMDGGGSSTMYVEEYGKPVNVTSDGPERAVANGVFVVANTPEDNEIGIIKPYRSSVSLPPFGEHIPQFYAYNQYEMLLESDLQGVVLSCPPSLGVIVDDTKFIATGSEPGYITATYGENITARIHVSFDEVTSVAIRLDSVIVDDREDYDIEVMATTSSGETKISSDALSWTIADPLICEINQGQLKALANGETTITGKIDDTEDSMKVLVQIPANQTITGDSLKAGEWTMSASSFLKAAWNEENLPTGWEHGAAANFKGAAGRVPSIKLTRSTEFFGLPDTVKLVLNIGDLPITRAIVSVKESGATLPVSMEFEAFELNRDFSLNLPLDQLFDIRDRAVFPVSFDNVNFYINASALVTGKDYTLAVREIALSYQGYEITRITQAEPGVDFQIYPNPVTAGELFLKTDETLREGSVVLITDIRGRRVYREEISGEQGSVYKIPTANLQSGLYLLTVKQENRESSYKFLIR